MSEHLIFVYGTLMKGERNHDRFLGDSAYAGAAVLSGYALFDLGSYPAIWLAVGSCLVCLFRLESAGGAGPSLSVRWNVPVLCRIV